MRNSLILAAALLPLVSTVSHAQEGKKVPPTTAGKAPTEAVGGEVPKMKGKCADTAGMGAKASGTEDTEATGSLEQAKKAPSGSDCVEDKPASTESSNN